MKRIILIISFSYLFQACQMFVAKNEQKEFVKSKSPFDNTILGLWENSMNNPQSPPTICAIKFEDNNEFIFYPYLGYGNNVYRKGRYKIVSDTLVLQFITQKYNEEYLFEYSENELNIKPIIHFTLTGSKENRIFSKKNTLDSYYLENFIEK